MKPKVVCAGWGLFRVEINSKRIASFLNWDDAMLFARWKATS